MESIWGANFSGYNQGVFFNQKYIFLGNECHLSLRKWILKMLGSLLNRLDWRGTHISHEGDATLLCRLHLWAQSSINQAKHEIMLTCVIAFVRSLALQRRSKNPLLCFASRSPYLTKNLGSEQYPKNGNLLICSTLEVGELTSQYISSFRIVTKIKKNSKC